MQPASLPVGQRLLRQLPLLLIWGAAISPVALWILAQQHPETVVRIEQVASRLLLQTLLVLLLAIALGALLFPPFPAWIRLAFERLRLHFASDRMPLEKALAELQHFESATRHLEIGRMALARSELQLAGKHLARAVELDAGIAGAHHHLGLLLLRIGQLQGAVNAFQNAERLDQGHAFGEALLGLGRTALLGGDAQGAARVLEQHQRQHGGSRKSHYWLGKARAATGDRAGAIAAMKVAAAPAVQKLTAEENWFRALARVWLWRGSRA